MASEPTLESQLPGVMESGLITNKNVQINANLTVTGTTNLSNVSFNDLTTTGNTTLGDTVSDTTTVNGVLTVTSTATVTGITTTGGVVVKSGTAVPASAGAVAAGPAITLFASGPSVYVTSDAPAFSAVKGSICIATNGSSSSTRLFVNNGTTNWVAITTAS